MHWVRVVAVAVAGEEICKLVISASTWSATTTSTHNNGLTPFLCFNPCNVLLSDSHAQSVRLFHSLFAVDANRKRAFHTPESQACRCFWLFRFCLNSGPFLTGTCTSTLMAVACVYGVQLHVGVALSVTHNTTMTCDGVGTRPTQSNIPIFDCSMQRH